MVARTASDRLISVGRKAWYSATEPLRLRLARALHGHEYDPGDLTYQHDPLISVYVPTYRRPEVLVERALASVASQTYRNIELIVANHGSDLATHQAVQDAFYDLPGCPNTIVIGVVRRRLYPPTPENHWLAGPVDPANAALSQCRGQWIARIDDDDAWDADHLETLLRFAQGSDYEFVSSAHRAVRDGKESIVRWDDRQPGIGGTQTWLYRSYLRFFRYNRDCWRKHVNRVNDTDLAERMLRAGVRTGFRDKPTCSVLPRPGETKIGLAAYRRDSTNKTKLYEFR